MWCWALGSLGFQAVAVLPLVPLHTLFMETRDPSLTAWFLLFFVLCCFAQRCNMWERRKRGRGNKGGGTKVVRVRRRKPGRVANERVVLGKT